MTHTSNWGAALEALQKRIHHLQAVPHLGSKGLGVPECDRELWRIGGEWLAAHGREGHVEGGPNPSQESGPDVYLATQVYRHGGHTALIGDFVRALAGETGLAAQDAAHLIVTNLHGHNPAPPLEPVSSRVGLAAANISVLAGPSLVDRLHQLFAQLLDLRPGRLFLFHHPDDPIACVVARPEIARQRFLVHHADAVLSFGLHLPGVQIVDLNPAAAAATRVQGLSPAWLPLTAPDPGPRPAGFLQRGKLVTATSGSQFKYSRPHFHSYPETVGVILRSTGGWHVHIGELDDTILSRIHDALRHAALPLDRFVHVPWVQSVSAALWEHQCDLYVSSFPIDGARTDAEVMASATPHLRYSARPGAEPMLSELSRAGGLVWHTWADLSATLRRVADASLLEDKSTLMRAAYDAMHHPRVFADRLRSILDGHGGLDDPLQHERDHRIVRVMLSGVTANVLELAHVMKGSTMRAKFLRWLLRP